VVDRALFAQLVGFASLVELDLAEESPEVLESFEPLESFGLDSFGLDESDDSDEDEDDDELAPLDDVVDDRESVMYQPLPLKTMPTGWMILRSVPPHCSHVVRRGSEKL
jgi:hypothetical protein